MLSLGLRVVREGLFYGLRARVLAFVASDRSLELHEHEELEYARDRAHVPAMNIKPILIIRDLIDEVVEDLSGERVGFLVVDVTQARDGVHYSLDEGDEPVYACVVDHGAYSFWPDECCHPVFSWLCYVSSEAYAEVDCYGVALPSHTRYTFVCEVPEVDGADLCGCLWYLVYLLVHLVTSVSFVSWVVW